MTSCSDDYLETNPTSSVSTATIFENTENVALAVNGIAKVMTMRYLGSQGFNGEGTIKMYWNNYADDDFARSNYSGWSTVANFNFTQNQTSQYGYYPWYYYYKMIVNANGVINNVEAAALSEGDTEETKGFLKAQALTFRAYAYTQLMCFYAKRWSDSNNGSSRGVVLRLDETETGDLAASTEAECYAQIYADLDEAISKFNAAPNLKRSGNWLPDVSVAHAVYALAAAQREDWSAVATHAAAARSGYSLMSNAEYVDGGFNAPNSEWIWSVYNAEDETLYYYSYFAYAASNSSASVCRNYPTTISRELYEQIPETDVRRPMWLEPSAEELATCNSVGRTQKGALFDRAKADYADKLYGTSNIYAYMQFKFQNVGQPGIGQFNLFRAAEMYLLEAEANCRQGNYSAARNLLTELNKTSGRDAAYDNSGIADADLLDHVQLYSRIELWGEGRGWFNYKRWGKSINRKSWADGGSFVPSWAVTITPEDKNAWTYVYPERETNYNTLVKTTE